MEEDELKPVSLYIAFFAIPIISNAFVATFINFILAKIIPDEQLYEIFLISNELAVLFNVAPFFYAIILLSTYSMPVFSALKSGQWSDLSLKRINNAALTIGLISFSAWLLPIAEVVVIFLVKSNGNWYRLISFSIINILTGTMSFLISYYSTDFIISRNYLIKLSRKFSMKDVPGIYYVSIRTKFLIFMISTSTTPVFLVSYALFSAHTNLIKNNLQGDSMIAIYFMVVFTVISLLLTFLISDDFHSPLTKLGDAANEISKGNFEINLPLLKSDEIGKLTERFNEMSLSLKEKEYIKDTFGKAVDPRVRDYMLGQNLKPGGELKFATVLFSDIRSFTTISENLNPDQVVDFLNIYFEKMSQCITEKGGIVNKYIGDAVMAIFGAPLDLENHFDLAFEAALNMIHARDALAKTFEMQGLPALRSGIGIHTGNLLSGNIGSKDRLEYTVIGDTVNLSSRIESLCKKTGHDFLISGETFDRLSEKNKAFCKYEGKVRVKGKTNTAKIYSVNHE